MKNKNIGIVYVLTNPAMPGLVKIGMTNKDNVKARMKKLYGSGVPDPFECNYACKVDSKDCEKIEKALHKAFAPKRINSNREFFQIDPLQAIAILELFDKEDLTEEVSNDIHQNLTSDDISATEEIKKSRRPPLNYFEMNLKKGDVLTFDSDPSQNVTISTEKKVVFNGQEMSLTAVTKSLLNITHAIQPTGYWSFNGKKLSEIYNETYPFE